MTHTPATSTQASHSQRKPLTVFLLKGISTNTSDCCVGHENYYSLEWFDESNQLWQRSSAIDDMHLSLERARDLKTLRDSPKHRLIRISICREVLDAQL